MAACTCKSLQKLDQADVHALRERDSHASGGDVSLLIRCEAPSALILYLQVVCLVANLRIRVVVCEVKDGVTIYHNLSRFVTIVAHEAMPYLVF